ncbi:hypothetical protein [Paraburkholderia sp. BL6669N2]|uniref:hypothetical protein n=1 Tax=Paraburkholderia sp. BL6669N2 TaxID=1938807 RepID=UPI0011C072CE|nr:hypothetical protein [Paraburkholderia sp. BL6669N2]
MEFDIGHPQALAVAVATRAAIEAGVLTEDVFDGPLANAKRRVAAIDALKEFQDQLEAAMELRDLMKLPDFYVLLVESGTWGFFRATESGFDPDVVPGLPDVTADRQEDRDVVLIAAKSSLRTVIKREISASRAFSDELFALDAGPVDSEMLRSVMSKTFPEKLTRQGLVA